MTGRIRKLRWAQQACKLLVKLGFYGAGALTCAAAVVTWQNSKHLGTGEMLLAVALQATPIVAVASILLYLGRTVHLWSGRRLVAADKRPSVAYLRSFEADEVPRPNFSPGSPSHGYPVAFEEEMTEVLWEVGPPQAVAAPGAWQTPLGFVRTALEEGEWQPQVRRRMQDAALVVILIGETPGLL